MKRRSALRSELPAAWRLYEIPTSIVELCPFTPDYADLFGADASNAAATPAEAWARAAMEGAPVGGRVLAWRVLCRLQLAVDGAPGHVAGWRVTGTGDDWVRVGARSWFMTACVVFKAEPDRILFGTLIRYDHAVARVIWGGVSAVHRAIAPAFLAGAVRRVERDARRSPDAA